MAKIALYMRISKEDAQECIRIAEEVMKYEEVI